MQAIHESSDTKVVTLESHLNLHSYDYDYVTSNNTTREIYDQNSA